MRLNLSQALQLVGAAGWVAALFGAIIFLARKKGN